MAARLTTRRGRIVRTCAVAVACLVASARSADAADARWTSIKVKQGETSDTVTAAGSVRAAKSIAGPIAIEFRCGEHAEVVPADLVRRSGSAITYRAPKGAAGLQRFSLSLATGKFTLTASGVEVGSLFDAAPFVLDVGGRRVSTLHELTGTGDALSWRKGRPLRTDLRVRVLEVSHVLGNALVAPAAALVFKSSGTPAARDFEVVSADTTVGADGIVRARIEFTDPAVLDRLDVGAVLGAIPTRTAPNRSRVTPADRGEGDALVFVERRNADRRTLRPGTPLVIDVQGTDGAPSGTLTVPAGAVAADLAGVAFTPVTFGVELPAPLPDAYVLVAAAELAADSAASFVPANAPTMELSRPRWIRAQDLAAADLRLLTHSDGGWAEAPGGAEFDTATDRVRPRADLPARLTGTGFAAYAVKLGAGTGRRAPPAAKPVRGHVLDRDGFGLRGQAVFTRAGAMVTGSDGAFTLERSAIDDASLEVVQAVGAVTSAARVVSAAESRDDVEVRAATAAPNVFRFGSVRGAVFEAGGVGPSPGATVTIRLASAVRGLLHDDGGTPDDASDDRVTVPDLGDFGVRTFAWHLVPPGDAAEFTSSVTGPSLRPLDLVLEADAAGSVAHDGVHTLRVSYTVPVLGEVSLYAGFRVSVDGGTPAVSDIQLPAALESTAAQSVVADADGTYRTFLRAPAGIPMTATAVSASADAPQTDTQIFPFAPYVTQDLAFALEPRPPVPAGLMQDRWVTRAPMPVARARAASAVLGGRVWVAGGVGTDGAPLASLVSYDPQTDAWTERAPMLAARDRCALVAAAGKLWVFGGNDGTRTLDSVECYDPATDRWSGRGPAPAAREDGQATAVGSRIFLTGGRVVRNSVVEDAARSVDVYDVVADAWTPGPEAPVGLAGGDAAVISGQVCVRGLGTPSIVSLDPVTAVWSGSVGQDYLGGHSTEAAVCATRGELCIVGGHDTAPLCKVWDPALDAYGHLPVPLTARTRPSAESIDGVVYAFGGFVGGVASATAEALRIPWERRADMPTARHRHAAASWRGRAYVAGGNDGDASVDVLEVYDPERDFWFRKAPMPEPRQEFGFVELDGRIYAIGGRRVPGDGTLTNVDAYDPVTDTWTPRAPLPRPRAHPVAGAIDGKLYVGSGGDDNLYSYDPAADAWTRLPAMRSARFTGAGGAASGALYVISGESASTFKTLVNERYDPAQNAWTIQASIPKERELHAAAVVGSDIWIVQGRYGTWPWWGVRYVTIYDTLTNTWRDGPPLPRAALDPAATVIGNDVYVFGGKSEAGQFDHYDIRDQVMRTTQVHRADAP